MAVFLLIINYDGLHIYMLNKYIELNVKYIYIVVYIIRMNIK